MISQTDFFIWFLTLYYMLFSTKMDKEIWRQQPSLSFSLLSNTAQSLKVELYVKNGSHKSRIFYFHYTFIFLCYGILYAEIIANSVFSGVDDLCCRLHNAKLEDIIFSCQLHKPCNCSATPNQQTSDTIHSWLMDYSWGGK